MYDGHGSTRLLTNNSGNITDRMSYDAYGNMLGGNPSALSPSTTSLLYSGESFDSNLQKQYLRARWYDQSNGRFNRLDPWRGNNQHPQSLHKYAYVHSDPVNGIDPSGLINFNLTSVLTAVGVISILASVISIAVAPTRGKAIWLAVDLATFPLAFVSAARALGKFKLLGGIIDSIKATKVASEVAARAWLKSRKLKIFLNDNSLKNFIGLSAKRVDFVAHSGDDGAKLIFVEGKKTLNSDHLDDMLEKSANSINAVKNFLTNGGQVYPGTAEIVITYKSVTSSGLGPSWTIDATGKVFQFGKQVIIDGVPLIAKQIPF